jgi:hypothetical protein
VRTRGAQQDGGVTRGLALADERRWHYERIENQPESKKGLAKGHDATKSRYAAREGVSKTLKKIKNKEFS